MRLSCRPSASPLYDACRRSCGRRRAREVAGGFDDDAEAAPDGLERLITLYDDPEVLVTDVDPAEISKNGSSCLSVMPDSRIVIVAEL